MMKVAACLTEDAFLYREALLKPPSKELINNWKTNFEQYIFKVYKY